MALDSSAFVGAAFSDFSMIATVLTPFVQEIMALSVFVAAFLVFRCLSQGHGRHQALRKKKEFADNKTAQSSAPTCGNKKHFEGARPRQPANKNNYASSPRSPPVAAMSPARVQAAESQILQHLEQMEFTRALNLYRSFEREGNEVLFSQDLFPTFIQSAIRVGKLDVVERMTRTMRRNCQTPPLEFWQTALKMLSNRKHYNACLSMAAIFDKQLPCDKTIYSCLINAALEVGDGERASGMLQRYAQSGLNDRDYVLFFRTFVVTRHVDAAEAIFQKLGSGMSPLMLNLLLLTCINAKDPERAHRLLHKAHSVEEGEKIVDTVSYNTVLKGFSQDANHDKCFEVLHEMLEKGFEPDNVTFGTLIDVCVVDQKSGTVNNVASLLTGRGKHMNTVMCTLFIKALVRSNSLPKALDVYEQMKCNEGAHPDIVTFSVLIKALVEQHDLEHALQLLDDLVKAGLAPDDIILTHLLEGCRHMANLELGKKLFTDLTENAEVHPSEITLVSLLKLHGRCGANVDAFELVSTWEDKYGFKPSVIHYTCMMSGCLRAKKYDDAWLAYELMCKRGVTPDETAISTLLPALVSAQHWERVLCIARKLLTPPVRMKVPEETLNVALSQMTAAGPACKRQADQLHELMREAGMHVKVRISKRSA